MERARPPAARNQELSGSPTPTKEAVSDTMPMGLCALLLIASYLSSQTGDFVIHMILHAVGHERYEVTPSANESTLKTTIEYTDRANVRTASATLRMKSDY